MSKLKLLHVHTTQGFAGELARESQYVFNYRTNASSQEIGLTMPLTAQSYAANILPGAIRQNLPEGFLLGWIRENFGKTMPMDDFNLVALTGRQTIGRVRCSVNKVETPEVVAGEDLKELLTWKGTESLFEQLSLKYAAASGISGVQPKVLIPTIRSDHGEVIEKSSMKARGLIVKAAGFDYDGLAENEFHCMSIAKAAGLNVPQFWLSDDKGLFIIERFDLDADCGYLGFEDMTSLMGKQNTEKYVGSYENVAKAVDIFAAAHERTASKIALFRSIVLSIAVRNGDAHLKNFGMLYTHPQSDDARLSPIYDIVNTTAYLPKDAMALSMNKTKAWPDRATLIEFGIKNCMIGDPAEIIDHVLEAAMGYRPAGETGPIWDAMRPAIERGCGSLRASQVLMQGAGIIGPISRKRSKP